MKHIVLWLVIAVSIRGAYAQWAGARIDTLTRNSLADDITKQPLAIDDAGTLHAVWYTVLDASGTRVSYCRRPVDGTWSQPAEVTVAASAPTPVLAVDKVTGVPIVAYIGAGTSSNEVIVARDSAGTWVRMPVTNDAVNDFAPTIAVDRLGSVHIAWVCEIQQGVFKIKYATNAGGAWQVQLLADSDLGPFGSGAEPFIAVTDSGQAHITYRGGDFGTYHIHHAWNGLAGGSTWMYQTLSTPNGNDFSSATVVTPDNTLHLLVGGNDGFGFPPRAYYMKKTTGGWSAPELANPGHSGWGGGLFIDRYGIAHITSLETSGNFYTGNLYYATNKSGSWSSTPVITDGATYNGIMVVGVDGRGYLLGTTGTSTSTQEIIAIRSSGIVTSMREKGRTPAATFRLEQNYPNPFNPTTTIEFSLPKSEYVTVEVYNLLGQKVETLVSGLQPAGTYTLRFDASNLPSGVYFYRLSAGQFAQTRKMILVR